MAMEMEKMHPRDTHVDLGPPQKPLTDEKGFARSDLERYDDDGHLERTGSWVVAYAHIVCAVIGSGVLSLAWGVSWLGWVAGPVVLALFAWITYFCSALLIDAYRYPTPDGQTRNYKYSDAVSRYMGKNWAAVCGFIQYVNMVGTAIGYTVTAGISVTAIKRSDCFHANLDDPCHLSNNPWIIMFGAFQIVLSQIQDIDRIWFMSVIATIMSFTYSGIGLGLCIAKATEHDHGTGTVDGLQIGSDTTEAGKAWGVFQALGDIAFAYSFSFILIEIMDTIKSPGENGKMKRATLFGISTTTFFYAAIGLIGYAAFGNSAPGNLLSGFGFYNPYWLVDIANAAIFVHLLGAYQVWIQPFFGWVEIQVFKAFPTAACLQYELFAVKVPGIGLFRLSPFRLIWRTIFVVIVTIVAALLPFFNDIVALLGAIGFGPLTVFFPIEMHIRQKNIHRLSAYGIGLQALNAFCMLISIVAAIGAVQGIWADTRNYTPFVTSYR